MTSVCENDLRAWLKCVWKRGESDLGIQWVEPAKGSSVGFPDALLPIWPTLVPVELKVAKQNCFDAFSCEVRPVQRRFHLLMEKQDLFSCFLIAEGSKNNFSVWLSHNSHYPWENKANAGETLIATNQKTNTSFARVVLIHEILRLMNKHNQVLLQIPGQSAE
jgi:hypothetical protein